MDNGLEEGKVRKGSLTTSVARTQVRRPAVISTRTGCLGASGSGAAGRG